MMDGEPLKALSGSIPSHSSFSTQKGSGAVVPHPPHLKKSGYDTVFDGKNWFCSCKHFKTHGSDCRHILEQKYVNLQTIYKGVLDKISEHRDSRDYECKSFDEVIEGTNRVQVVHDLCLLVRRIALEQGSVCSDDLHAVTNEVYRDDRIVGTVFGVLLKQGIIECVGRQATVRKCAHGRSIGVYRLVQKMKVLPVVPLCQRRLDEL